VCLSVHLAGCASACLCFYQCLCVAEPCIIVHLCVSASESGCVCVCTTVCQRIWTSLSLCKWVCSSVHQSVVFTSARQSICDARLSICASICLRCVRCHSPFVCASMFARLRICAFWWQCLWVRASVMCVSCAYVLCDVHL
jgi:hypothetical protein